MYVYIISAVKRHEIHATRPTDFPQDTADVLTYQARLFHTLSHTHTHMRALSHVRARSLSLSHTHALSLSLTHMRALSHTLSLTHALSLSHTHSL